MPSNASVAAAVAAALASFLLARPLPPAACPFTGLDATGSVLVTTGQPPQELVPGISVDLYEHAIVPFGSAQIVDVPNSPVNAKRIELLDARLTVDVSGSRRTRIWYDDLSSTNDEKSIQIDGLPTTFERFLLQLPDTIGGARVFHSYAPPNWSKGVIDLVGEFDQVRIGGQELAIESLCTSAYTCDSVDSSLASPIVQDTVDWWLPATWCVEVTLIAPEDRLLEAVTFEGMKRDFLPEYTVSAVVYEVDPKDPTQGTLVASQSHTGGTYVGGDPRENLAILTGTTLLEHKDSQGKVIKTEEVLTTGGPLRGIPPADVRVPFGGVVLKVGKTYRIGLGWEPGSTGSTVGVTHVKTDRVYDSAFEFADPEALFAVSGAYYSKTASYPAIESRWGVGSQQNAPRIRLQSRCP